MKYLLCSPREPLYQQTRAAHSKIPAFSLKKFVYQRKSCSETKRGRNKLLTQITKLQADVKERKPYR